jgi:hypothetical protein
MFFRKPSRSKSNRRAPRRFRLEALEIRNCLSTLGVGLEAQTVSYPNVQVSGAVYGSGQGYQVTLSGAVNASVGVNSSGQFTYNGPASGLGTVTATATDTAGDSGQASTGIMHMTPQVNGLGAMPTGPGKQVDITGSVSADNPAGLTVTFSGSAGVTGSTTTNSNGSFNLVKTATGLGSVTAVVTDDWGVQSAPNTTQIMDYGPRISNFTVTATGQGKQVDVSGSVSATPPAGLTVTFSGSAGVTGSATTDSNGNFNVLTTAANLGSVTAVVPSDAWGVSSSPATTNLMVQAPYIAGLTATKLGNGEWQITGTVSGLDVKDDTVQLSGVISTSATPNNSGSFSVTVQISGNPNGTEYALATDIWGQTSNEAEYMFFG